MPQFPEVIGLLGNDPNAGRLAAEVALRGGSVVVCGDRSVVFAGIAIAENRGFVTPLEAEQAWRRVRASDTLDGFDQAGLVFVAEGQNPFRLAAAIRPRTIVCVDTTDWKRSTRATIRSVDAVPVPATTAPRELLR